MAQRHQTLFPRRTSGHAHQHGGKRVWLARLAVDSPPSKVVPPDCPRQNNRSPRTKYRSHTWSPLLPTVPPAADCGHLAIAFATALAYGEQPGRCPFNQNKVRQHQLKSLQDGEMTPLPSKKNRRNGRRVKTWNTIQIRCSCRMLTVWERVSCMTGLLFASERLQYMLPHFIYS